MVIKAQINHIKHARREDVGSSVYFYFFGFYIYFNLNSKISDDCFDYLDNLHYCHCCCSYCSYYSRCSFESPLGLLHRFYKKRNIELVSLKRLI